MPSDVRKKTGSPEAKTPSPGTFFAPYGSRFGSPRCPGNGDVRKSCKSERKSPLSIWKAVILWLRGLDLNQRPPGYELRWVSPSAAAQCFPGLLGPEMAQNPKVIPLRSTAVFSDLGQSLGQVTPSFSEGDQPFVTLGTWSTGDQSVIFWSPYSVIRRFCRLVRSRRGEISVMFRSYRARDCRSVN